MTNTSAVEPVLAQRCKRADSINLENLNKILSDNKDTLFGREHGFADIKSADEYRRRVCIYEYGGLEHYIRRMRNGEDNILTSYKVVSYCMSSGTTGDVKYIPVTDETLIRHTGCYENYKNSVLRVPGTKRLMVNSFRTDLEKPIEQELLFTEIYYRHLYENGYINTDEYIGGKTVMFITENENVMFAKLWEALLNENVISIESVFLYEHLVLLSMLESSWETITGSIRSRSFPDDIQLSQRIKDYLLSLPVDEQRLRYVESECKKGFDNIVGRLWKKMKLMSGISNRSYLTEEEALKRYAPDIPRHFMIYGSSECHIAAPVRLNEYGYVLFPQLAFFEFLPIGAKDDETVLPHEVKVGELYEPIFTNFTGLYRYRLRDVVRITGFVDKSPVMEFVRRLGQAINIAGEKFDQTQLENGVYKLKENGIHIENYCFGACMETMPGKYAAAVQLSSDSREITDNELARLLDEKLMQVNNDYKDLRGLGEIDMPFVIQLDKAKYADFTERMGLSHKNGHNKAKHIYYGEVILEKWH